MEIIEIELAFLHFSGHFGSLGLINAFCGLFDKADNVAHAENAIGDARGMKIFEIFRLFADANELDRLAGDSAHGKRRPAAAIAIDTGEHDSGDIDPLVKRLREIDSILTGQAVGDEQHFVRVRSLFDVGHFLHQRFVDGETTGGIENEDIIAAEASGHLGAFGDGDRHLALDDRQGVDLVLLTQNRKLPLCCRAAHVERSHQDLFLVAGLKAAGNLGRSRGLARSLKANHHDRDRRRRGKIDLLRVRAEHGDEFIMHDLDDHLAGLDGFQHFRADRLGAHAVRERTHHIERHIGLDQGTADFAHRLGHVIVGQRAAFRQALKYGAKAIGQTIKHRVPSVMVTRTG